MILQKKSADDKNMNDYQACGNVISTNCKGNLGLIVGDNNFSQMFPIMPSTNNAILQWPPELKLEINL